MIGLDGTFFKSIGRVKMTASPRSTRSAAIIGPLEGDDHREVYVASAGRRWVIGLIGLGIVAGCGGTADQSGSAPRDRPAAGSGPRLDVHLQQ